GRPIFGIGNLLAVLPQTAATSSAAARLPMRWRRTVAHAPSRGESGVSLLSSPRTDGASHGL
ncbi:hypothetical protein HAX54_045978, partial [Datura stramonium]|nr:hypothetical protein [Datura stramonium]